MRPAPSPESPHWIPYHLTLIAPSSLSHSKSSLHGTKPKANWRQPPLASSAAGIQYIIQWAPAFIEMYISCRQTDPPLCFPLLSLQCPQNLSRQPPPPGPPLAPPFPPPVPPRHESRTPPAKAAPGKYPTPHRIPLTFLMLRIHTELIGTMSHLTTV